MQVSKQIRKISLLLVIIFSVSLVQAQNKSKIKLKNTMDSASYAIGLDLGGSYFKAQGIEVNVDVLAQGIKDAMSEKGVVLFDDAMKQKVLIEFNQSIKKKQEAEKAAVAGAEKEKSAKFLEENKTKEGVKVTESGLQYKVVKEGVGISPVATDEVKVHYTGKLLDGTVFDSSVERGEPITFGLNRVIPGWTEGLQLMKEGAKYIFYIPSNLAYGDAGAGGQIPGGAALIFEVELLQVIKK